MVSTTTTRTLFHFPLSPFSRRARLALAHKGIAVELRDGRADAAALAEAQRLSATKTIPVYVERAGDETRVLGDSSAIAHYLEATYRDAPPLFPDKDAALVADTCATVDAALNAIVDLGVRYYALREHAAWAGVKGEMIGRAQRALDALGDRVMGLGRPTISRAGWSAADAWLYAGTAWLEGAPARAATSTNIAQILTLGWMLPAALSRWADAHRERADVKALDA
jgi:glutathione S-transferase